MSGSNALRWRSCIVTLVLEITLCGSLASPILHWTYKSTWSTVGDCNAAWWPWIMGSWSKAERNQLGGLFTCQQEQERSTQRRTSLASPRKRKGKRRVCCQWGPSSCSQEETVLMAWGFGPNGPEPLAGWECLRKFVGVGGAGYSLSCLTQSPGGVQVLESLSPWAKVAPLVSGCTGDCWGSVI